MLEFHYIEISIKSNFSSFSLHWNSIMSEQYQNYVSMKFQ